MLDLWPDLFGLNRIFSLDGPDYYASGGAIDFFIDEQRGPLGADRGEQIGAFVGQSLQQLLFPDYGGGQEPPVIQGPMSEQLGVNNPFDPMLYQLPRINLGGLEIEIGGNDPPSRNPFSYPQIPAPSAPDANYPTVEYQTRRSPNMSVRFGCAFSPKIFKWIAPYLVRAGVLANHSPGVQWSQDAVRIAYEWWLSNGQPCPRKKRMNPLNPYALKRAVRRLAGFQKFQKSTEKVLRKMVPMKALSRGRGFASSICANCRKSPCGCK